MLFLCILLVVFFSFFLKRVRGVNRRRLRRRLRRVVSDDFSSSLFDFPKLWVGLWLV